MMLGRLLVELGDLGYQDLATRLLAWPAVREARVDTSAGEALAWLVIDGGAAGGRLAREVCLAAGYPWAAVSEHVTVLRAAHGDASNDNGDGDGGGGAAA